MSHFQTVLPHVRRASLRRIAGITVLLPMFALTACSVDDPLLDPPAGAATIVVGAGTSVDGALIAQIYAGALARAGAKVHTASGRADRAASLAALDSGQVSVVPERTGALLNYLQPDADLTDPDKVFVAVNRALPDDLAVGDYAPADEGHVLVVAASHKLRTIGDLVPRCESTVLGVTGTGAEIDSLRSVYGCAFASVRPYASGELAAALASGEIQAALTTSMSPTAHDDRFTALVDDKHAFTPENVVPLYRKSALDKTETTKLNAVAGELTTSELVDMDRQVRAGTPVADVVTQWLDARGI